MSKPWFDPDVIWIHTEEGDMKVSCMEPIEIGDILVTENAGVRRARHDDKVDALIGVAMERSLTPPGVMRIWDERAESDR